MRVPSGGCGATICATGGEMVRAEDVISIYQSLSANKIQVWLTGGWGIDALLQEMSIIERRKKAKAQTWKQ